MNILGGRHILGYGRRTPTKPLNVTAEEKEKLTLLARRPKTGQALAMGARMVPGCSDGRSNGVVARRLRVTGATVCQWRERFRVSTAWKGCSMSPGRGAAIHHGRAG